MTDTKNKTSEVYDIAIIGGGINGCGIAREAAGRGLKVFLCEKGDLGAATSWASSKLIHGGLRYLEQYDFSLVRKALKERKKLLTIAPHISYGSTFILPYEKHLRSKLLLRTGLFIYDFLAPKHLEKSKYISFNKGDTKGILKSTFTTGFSYSDGRTDDHRLVILNALDAQKMGAKIHTFNGCKKVYVEEGLWHVELENAECIQARTLINATGPWASTFLREKTAGVQSRETLRLVKGSHIVVPKIYQGAHCYIFQSADKRIIFAMPYEENFTLIGTTDVAYEGDPQKATCSASEKEYLINLCNHYFEKQLNVSDILWDFAGVRPLIEDRAEKNASTASRDYRLSVRYAEAEFDTHKNTQKASPPLLNIWGGKLTTYRTLSFQALEKLMPYLEQKQTRKRNHIHAFDSGKKMLPGAIQPWQLMAQLKADYPFLSESMIQRFARTYGTLCLQFLEEKNALIDLGTHFGADLYQAEVDYLIQYEWAKTGESILFYRTKRGLHLSASQQKELNLYVQNKVKN